MPKIQDVLDIPCDATELLGVVGYLDVDDLTSVEVKELHPELIKANDKFSILENTPTIEQILQWQKALLPDAELGEVVKDVAEVNLGAEVANLREDNDMAVMLAVPHAAELLPDSVVRKSEVAVKSIPAVVSLTERESDQDTNVTLSATVVMAEEPENRMFMKGGGLDTSRIRSFDQMDVEAHSVKPLERGVSREVISVSKDLNKGLSPESRRFIRGVLHSNPVRVRVAAFCTTCVTMSLIATFVMIPLLLLFEYYSGQSTIWYVVGIASALLASAVSYLFWGVSARCRICGQRLYAPKKCLKHRKAHRISLLGYILPTALHTLLYNWIYCTYCGTAVRLKK